MKCARWLSRLLVLALLFGVFEGPVTRETLVNLIHFLGHQDFAHERIQHLEPSLRQAQDNEQSWPRAPHVWAATCGACQPRQMNNFSISFQASFPHSLQPKCVLCLKPQAPMSQRQSRSRCGQCVFTPTRMTFPCPLQTNMANSW